MANALYEKAKQSFLSQSPSIDMDADSIKVIGVNQTLNGGPPAVCCSQWFDDIAIGAIVFTSSDLTSKTTTLGVFDAADVTILGVSGVQVDQLTLFKDTGTPSTSPVICFFTIATGLPFTPNGGDVLIQWDNGSNKIFSI